MGSLSGLVVLIVSLVVWTTACCGRTERRMRPQEQRGGQQSPMANGEYDELVKKGDECMALQEFSNEEVAAIQQVETQVMKNQGSARNERYRPGNDRQRDQAVLQTFYSTIDSMFDKEMSERLKQKLQNLADCIQRNSQSE